jgi:hypothetical protein
MERAGIFDGTDDFDVSGFAPRKPKATTPREAVQKVAEAANFTSREAATPEKKKDPKRAPRRHVTGRNVHFGAKVTQQTYDALYELADSGGWVIGEMLERAVNALKREIGAAKGQG